MWNHPLAPQAASKDAASYDALFWTIVGLTAFFTLLVGAVVLFLAVRYRAANKVDRSNPPHHNTMLELTWTILPLFLALGIFAWSAINFVHARTMPKDGIDIFVIGKQWMWQLQHMDGTRENNELHIPVNVPVTMTMISQDVIHSMYLPEFRAQYHVVPGRYTKLQFTPIKTGRYRLLCAMHCGAQHSEMVGWVEVMSQKDFATWQEQKGNKYRPKETNVVNAGKQIWDDKKCGSCHGTENTQRGPSLVGITGKTRKFNNNLTAVADSDYLRASILDPYKLVTAGYDATMPSYQGQLTEEDVLALIAYIQSMGGNAGAVKPYSKKDLPSYRDSNLPDNATDVANKQGSAEAGHSAEQLTR